MAVSSTGSASISGLISGLDTDGIIAKMLEYAKKPMALLQGKQAGYTEKLAAWQNANTRLLALKTNAISLSRTINFQGKTASTDVPDSLGVSVSAAAVAGTYTITVNRLATAEQRQSQSFADTDKAVVGTGSITVGVGDAAKTISIDGTNNTLGGLRDAINRAGVGVTASITDLGSQGSHDYRLVLTANSTGEKNAITWTPTLSGGSAPAWTVTTAAQDSSITVGSGATAATITQSGNTVNSVYPGVTLTLKAADTARAIKLTVSADTAGLKDAIGAFVDQYNSLMDFLNDQQKFDTTTNTNGALFGDYALQNVEDTLRAGVLNAIPGLPTSMSSLSQIGFSTDQSDHLVLNAETLSTALAQNPDGAMKLFASYGETSDQSVAFVSAGTKTQASPVGAAYRVRIDQPATATTVTAGAAQTGVLTADQTLTINSAVISLKAGWTQQQVVDAVNARRTVTGISASSTGADGTGTGDFLTLKSDALGSSSHISVVGSLSNGGASVPTADTAGFGTSLVTETSAGGEGSLGHGAQGKDVAGAFGVTVNGVTTWETATGQGKTLTGASGNKYTEDLAVSVSATTAGEHGTVSFTLGVAAQLNSTLDYLTGTNGAVTTAQDVLNSQIKDVKDTITSQQDWLTAYEARIRSQFLEMESQMGELQSQGNYLSAQFKAMSNASSK